MLAQRGCYCFSLAVGKLGGGGGERVTHLGLRNVHLKTILFNKWGMYIL